MWPNNIYIVCVVIIFNFIIFKLKYKIYVYILLQNHKKMFSALNEKVERLEKENEDLKARLSAIEARLVEKTNQEDSKRFEEMVDERLGHHVCVGISIGEKALFKNVNNFLTYDPEHPEHVSWNFLGDCRIFNIESVKFFPIFAEIGFDLYNPNHRGVYFKLQNKNYYNAYTINNNNDLQKYDDLELVREAFMKYGVRLLFKGLSID